MNSTWLIFQNKHLLVLKKQEGYAVPTNLELTELFPALTHSYLIGHLNDTDYHCAELPTACEINPPFLFLSLKKAFEQLGKEWFSLFVKSMHIIDWDKNHEHCGICGSKTQKSSLNFEAFCKPCNARFYPRISPSIIVLINKGHQILMARGPHFPEGVYGLIAGFVSPGETLEEAVHREVSEEVSIKVKNIQYAGSQPWPFPDSLMVAFTAEYDSGEIKVDNLEIIEADWYGIDNLPGYPSSSISIARSLIEEFIKKEK